MTKLYPLFYLLSALLFTACDAQKKSTEPVGGTLAQNNSLKDCPDDLMCTMDFRLLSIQIKFNPDNRPDSVRTVISNDELTVLNSQKSEDIQSMTSGWILATDSDMHLVSKSGTPVSFHLYKEGQIIHSEEYVVAHDCCHIQLKKGRREIDLR